MRTAYVKKTITGYVGKTMKEIADTTTRFWYPVRVFLLQDEQDNTGRPDASGYTVKNILGINPNLTNAVVKYAEFYYGETILRVLANS